MTFKSGVRPSGKGVSTSGGARGGGGSLPVMLGGGGLGTLLLVGLFLLLGGDLGSIGGGGIPQQEQNQVAPEGFDLTQCAVDGAVNEIPECRAAATADSLNSLWPAVLAEQAGLDYSMPSLQMFQGNVQTGCGFASSDTGPFYCPRDQTVYLDVTFYHQLQRLGGSDGSLSQMYVLAHEWGHHIQNIEGTLGLSDYNNPGEDSAAVAIELQADCYAGIWASRADKGADAMLEPITEDQVMQAVQTARAIGDDHIQERSGREVNPDSWTHGSSEQRQKAFLAGYSSGQMKACDTLNRGVYK
ncbi:metalloprotease [Corynebacterium tuscaniense]|uniref:Metalloprotease n=1 Tax=Corynebacterium tuscaniense TaxID=302449 RepID=A0A2N6T5V5_9CORY|nr:neutral zinc metallopeptidase [Corynebacterium tuscaniense]KAA8745018.1 metalloprotease [Corynebacterium tuscaniense]KGF23586.1 metalloprotease [Corynebacterium tuscaniense DNF00037]PMC64690.1 metalloprotease [Corynebacterium tuscaniense]